MADARALGVSRPPAGALPRSAGVPGALRVVVFRALSLVFLCALAGLLARYPLGAAVAGGALAAYAVVLWCWPNAWLFAVPALLPVLDLSAWSGWFYVREGDFLLLATAAVGYWRLAPVAPVRFASGAKAALLVLVACSFAISAYRGLDGLPPLDLDSFSNYQSPYNALRVLSGFAWVLVLLPLAARALGQDHDSLRRYLIPGMVAGLALCALVVVWERIAFPGIMDFSSDYRVTGSFSDMHTGGAALDGYVILALSFGAVWALAARKPLVIAAATSSFVVGTYAMLVTFSRSTYAAYALVLVIVLFFSVQRVRSGRTMGVAWAVQALLVFAVTSYVLVRVFATGGYRALAAVLGMCAAAFFYGAVDLRIVSGARAALIAAIGVAAMAALAVLVPKGAYLGYAAALGVLLTGLLWYWAGRSAGSGATVAAAALPLLAVGALLVAWHWGGTAALIDAMLALAVVLCLIGYNRYALRPLWSLARTSILPAVLAAVALGLFVPVVNNSYVEGRFATLNQDFEVRLAHWRDGIAMIDSGWTAPAFGMGLGTFPRTYFWRNFHGEFPGVQQYRSEGDNAMLRLAGPRYQVGYGEALRVFQTVALEPHQVYRLSFEARGNVKEAKLHLGVCEKWLIYLFACPRDSEFGPQIGHSSWTRYEKEFNSGNFGAWHWYGHRPMRFLLYTENAGALIDVDNVALIDSTGRNLIRNGDFSAGPKFWFFSSDRHHLPWHAKNMFLHVYFEQGGFGLVLFAALYLYAMLEFARRAWQGDTVATALCGALGGLAVVGVFDSLLDIPRVTTLAYFFMALALFPASASDRAAQSAAPSTGSGQRQRSGPRGSSHRGSVAPRQ